MVDSNSCVVCGVPTNLKTYRGFYDKNGKEITKTVEIGWCPVHYREYCLTGKRLPEEVDKKINVAKPKVWQDGKVNVE